MAISAQDVKKLRDITSAGMMECKKALEEANGSIDDAVDVLRKLGAEIVDIHLPHTAYAIATYYIICTAEASANLARYDGVRYTTRSAAAHR